MKTTIARCLVGLELGADALTMTSMPQVQAVETAGGIEFGVRGLAFVPTGSFSIWLFEGIGARRGGETLTLPGAGRGGVPAGADSVVPARLVETRTTPNGTVDDREQRLGRFGADSERTFELAGRGSVPANAADSRPFRST